MEKWLRKNFFDKMYYDGYDEVLLYPEAIADWYGEYIAIYTTIRTSSDAIVILDKDLKTYMVEIMPTIGPNI